MRSALRLVAPLALSVVSALVSLPAAAMGVFLNGVNIDGVTGQKFEGCTVVIDDAGNVRIEAPGYIAQAPAAPAGHAAPPAPATTPSATAVATPATATPAAATQPAQAPLTRRYFLVSEASAPGMDQYQVDVFMNARWVKRIASTDGQVVVELTREMNVGRNVVHFSAQKLTKEGRRSVEPGHWLKLHIGEGVMTGNSLTLENPLVEFVRTAAQTDSTDEEAVVEGR